LHSLAQSSSLSSGKVGGLACTLSLSRVVAQSSSLVSSLVGGLVGNRLVGDLVGDRLVGGIVGGIVGGLTCTLALCQVVSSVRRRSVVVKWRIVCGFVCGLGGGLVEVNW
jgi:hypothetical protein